MKKILLCLTLLVSLTGCKFDKGECVWREHVQIQNARIGHNPNKSSYFGYANTTYCLVPFNGEPFELEFEGHIGQWVDLCEYHFKDGHVELILEESVYE